MLDIATFFLHINMSVTIGFSHVIYHSVLFICCLFNVINRLEKIASNDSIVDEQLIVKYGVVA